MTGRNWAGQVAAAAGAAAGLGAAQLGLGYGLGIITWPAEGAWLAGLGWATWIPAAATVVGAVLGASRPGALRPAVRTPAWAGPRSATGPGGPWRLTLAAAAAVGALLTVVLIAIPARSAVRFAQAPIAGAYALLGVLIGMVIAYWAVRSRPVAANVIAMTAWLWITAVAAVIIGAGTGRTPVTYLATVHFIDPGARLATVHGPSAGIMLAAAFVLGLGTAWPSVRRRRLGLGTATSGAAGPLLVAIVHFVLMPQFTEPPGPVQTAFLTSPYAVLTGLGGSALAVALGRRSVRRQVRRAVTGRRHPGSGLPVDAPPASKPALGKPDRTQPDRTQPDRTQPDVAGGVHGFGLARVRSLGRGRNVSRDGAAGSGSAVASGADRADGPDRAGGADPGGPGLSGSAPAESDRPSHRRRFRWWPPGRAPEPGVAAVPAQSVPPDDRRGSTDAPVGANPPDRSGVPGRRRSSGERGPAKQPPAPTVVAGSEQSRGSDTARSSRPGADPESGRVQRATGRAEVAPGNATTPRDSATAAAGPGSRPPTTGKSAGGDSGSGRPGGADGTVQRPPADPPVAVINPAAEPEAKPGKARRSPRSGGTGRPTG